MRIALISTRALSAPPKKYGGTELVVAELAKGLLGLGHEVTVFATGDSGVFGDLRHHFARPVWPPNELAECRHAGFAWKDIAHDTRGFDVVHAHHATALPFHFLSALPTVLTVHHMRVDSLIQHYLSYPDVALVAISDRQAALSPELRFARTIHHGLDPSLYAAGSGDGDYLAFLGRFAPEKAPHVAIDAARAAGMRLMLGGEAHQVPESQSYFERELKPRLASTQDLEWCGEAVRHGPKVRLLGGARALLFPLDWEEPFGLVMIEAMLMGTPVIAYARGSAPEVIEEGVTGYLVHNADQMAERIRQLDRIDRVRCRARAQARWGVERMAREYAGLYMQLRERTGRAARNARVVPLMLPAPAGSGEAAASRTRAAAGPNMVQSIDETRERTSDLQLTAAAADSGCELVLSSARDTEQLVCARGSLFLVTERHGDVAPAGARELGLFHNDTRYLSHLELRIDAGALVFLSAETSHDAFNQVDLMVSRLDQGEFLDDPQNFLHVRRRQLLEGGLVESLTLTNFLSRPVSVTLELHFNADFADIFEVRGAKRRAEGKLQRPRVEDNTVVHVYEGLDGVRYSTEFGFSPQPSNLSANLAQFRLELVAGGSQQLEISVTPHRDLGPNVRAPVPFDQRIARQTEQTRGFREASTRVRCDDAMLQSVFDQSVVDLYQLRVQVGSLQVVAAGIPWFCCPFGRDSLLTSYESLVLNPELAMQSLRVLAAFQGKRDHDLTEEEPGKIMHELRFGEMANTGEMPHSPYYGTVDATPLFVVVADAAYHVTADVAFVRELREPLLAALGWIDRHSQNATQLVSYQRRSPRGLDNQGWKDSRAGVSFPDGRRAEPPIALCEVQGYCADAYQRGARLLGVLGERELAATYAGRAAALRALVEDRMWLPEHGRYAFAIDGKGRALDTVVSNLGHLLWSRVPNPEHAIATAQLLMDPASFSGFGIRTLATGQPVYNPLSYHNGTVWPHDNALIAKGFANYGMTREAARGVFDGMIRSVGHFRDRRLPELFCGLPSSSGSLVRYPVACSPQAWASAAPFLLLQASLGLHLDAPNRLLSISNASLPGALEWVELEGLRIGPSRVTLRLRRGGERVHIERLDVSGPAIRTEIEID